MKKIIIASIITVTLVGTSAVAFISNEKPVKKEQTNSIAKNESIEPIKEQPKQVETVVVTEEIASPPITTVVEPIKSSIPTVDELAAQYTTLTADAHQKACFDKIVAYYPERFTEDNRVNNVNFLGRGYASACALYNNYFQYILGLDGAYFDSEYAKQFHN